MNIGIICLGILIFISVLSMAWAINAARLSKKEELKDAPFIRGIRNLYTVFTRVVNTTNNPSQKDLAQYKELGDLMDSIEPDNDSHDD